MDSKITKKEDGGLITNDVMVLANDKTMFTSLNLDDKDSKIKLYNSLQKCDVRINDIVGQEIEFSDIFIEEKPFAEIDEKTGEVIKETRKFRTILYGTNDVTYVSSAYGVYNSLKNIVSIFGLPTKTEPIKVIVNKRPTNNGRETLILVVQNA